MKTYSETMKSVLEKAAEITEEKQAKMHKTRSRLKTVLGAALAFALIIGAVLVIKPFGERGNGGQLGYGAKNTSDAAKVTPDCMEDNTHKNTPEPAPSVFITDTTAVKSYEQGDSVNAELALSMLRSEGYIEADTGTLRVNYYNTSHSVLRNCTPDYILEHGGGVEYTHTWKVGVTPPNISEHGGDIDLFQDESGAYFIRLLDRLYRYDSFGGRHINMCRWDYDSNGAADLVFYSNFGSGLDYHSVSIFDLSTRTIKEIIVKMTLAEPSFRFDFDGESIYIDGNKVEYVDGEFYIGGMKAEDYRASQFEPKNTPEPSDHPGYAYPSILCIAPDDFSFAIQWGVGAYSSYDSKTGRLVKTTHTTHPEDYVTHLSLSEYEINRFYTFITWHMDIFEMPDEYDPINDPASESKIQSEPYETIILTVHADGREKTVTCPEIPLGDHYGYCHHAYTFYNMTVRYITDLLMRSPAWQALPEYEFFYE